MRFKIYVCPHAGERYYPSKLQDSDVQDTQWARCTRCDAHGRRWWERGFQRARGQWHGVRRISILGMQADLAQLAQARQLVARVQAARQQIEVAR